MAFLPLASGPGYKGPAKGIMLAVDCGSVSQERKRLIDHLAHDPNIEGLMRMIERELSIMKA